MSAKLSIVGAGSVGATLAYAALIRGIASRIALYDVNRAKVEAERLDLAHGAPYFPPASIEAGDDLQICEGSAVVVVAAGAKQKPGQSRLELASTNVRILRDLLPPLLKVAPDAIFLIVSNPVDVLTRVALQVSGLPRERVFGSGTVLDSARFRYLIAQRLRVAPKNVHAYIGGEHGDSSVPLWSSATVGGIPLHQWAVQGHGRLTVRDRVEIFTSVKDAAAQIIAGKGATNYAIGLAGAEILGAILDDANVVLPVSTMLRDYEGINDVCLSLPCIVSARGAEAPLQIPLNDAELAGLRASADTIRATLAGVAG